MLDDQHALITLILVEHEVFSSVCWLKRMLTLLMSGRGRYLVLRWGMIRLIVSRSGDDISFRSHGDETWIIDDVSSLEVHSLPLVGMNSIIFSPVARKLYA